MIYIFHTFLQYVLSSYKRESLFWIILPIFSLWKLGDVNGENMAWHFKLLNFSDLFKIARQRGSENFRYKKKLGICAFPGKEVCTSRNLTICSKETE